MKKQPTSVPVVAAMPGHGILLRESLHARDFKMARVARPYWKLIYVIQGETRVHTQQQSIHLGEKEFAVIPRGVGHWLEDVAKESPIALNILSIEDHAFHEDSAARRILNATNAMRNPDIRKYSTLTDPFIDLPGLLRKIKHEQMRKETVFELAVKNLALDLLIRLHRAAERKKTLRAGAALSDRAVLAGIYSFVANNYFESINVAQVAARCSFSVRRLSGLFKRRYGQSIISFLHQRRVNAAKKLLRQSAQPIAAVCFDVGFNDLSFFYRIFKKHTGLSPLAYRNGKWSRKN